MNTPDVAMQMKSLRIQLDVLAAKLRSGPATDDHTLADLHGMLADQAQTSVEEIDNILYREPAGDE